MADRLIPDMADVLARAKRQLAEFRALHGVPDELPISSVVHAAVIEQLPPEDAAKFVDQLDPAAARHTRQRHDLVEKLSREGRLVREIAEQLGYSYGRVVEIRALRGCGKSR